MTLKSLEEISNGACFFFGCVVDLLLVVIVGGYVAYDVTSCVVVARVVGSITAGWTVMDFILLGLIVVEVRVVATTVPSGVVSMTTIEEDGILLGLIVSGTFSRFISTNDTIGTARVGIGMGARIVAVATVVKGILLSFIILGRCSNIKSEFHFKLIVFSFRIRTAVVAIGFRAGIVSITTIV